MSETGIGASVKRLEDYRFLTGRGTYTDDINQPGQTYAYILRSPHANATINAIDTSAAAAAPGVVAIFTGADMEVGSLPCGWQVNNKDGSPMAEPGHPPLAQGKVRHVGDQVAVVIAESLAEARSAAELIEVDYTEHPAVIDMRKAIEGGPAVHDDVPSNICYDWELGVEADVDAAFANAHHVTEIDIVNNRLIPNAIEPRAAIGSFDRATGDYTLYTTSQNPHVIRLLMGAFVLQIPEHKLRIVAPDVGGGFGSKIYHYAEEAIVTWAAPKVGRPIKWTAERSESFMTDAHARDHISHAKLAMDENGKFLALKVDTLANMGAYLSTFSTCVPTYLYATLLAGVYTTPLIYCGVKAIFTNTVPVDAYRGAGRPEATYLLERLVDRAAREMGMDQQEIRRRNFIPSDAFPYQTPVALEYDSGDYDATLNAAIAAGDVAGFAARKAASAANGKCRGIGYSTYVEACGIAPSAVVGSLGARAGLFESVRENERGQALVADISARLVTAPIERIDEQIRASLSGLSDFLHYDRAALVLLSDDGTEATAVDVILRRPQAAEPGVATQSALPWHFSRFRAGDIIHIARVADLPDEATAERARFTELGITSYLSIPLKAGEDVFGAISFAAFERTADWPQSMIPRLKLIGEIIAAALARKRAVDALRRTAERFQLAINGSREGLWDWDMQTDKVWYSPVWRDMIGFSEADMATYIWSDHVHPDDLEPARRCRKAHFNGETEVFRNEYRHRHKDGHWIWIEARGACARDDDGKPVNFAGHMTDISDRKNAEARLQQQTNYDHLTGLPTNHFALPRLEQALKRAGRIHHKVAVIAIGGEEIERVATALGRAARDAALLEISRRLQSVLGDGDWLFRSSTYEFLAVLPDIATSSQVEQMALALLQTAHEPIRDRDADRGGLAERRHHRGAKRRRHRDGDRAQRPRRPAEGARERRQYPKLLLAGPARRRGAAPGHARQPARGGRARGSGSAISAVDRRSRRRADRRRGAAALGPSRFRHRAPRSVHPDRRGVRPDRAHRRVGAAHGLSPGPVPGRNNTTNGSASRSTCRRARSRTARSPPPCATR